MKIGLYFGSFNPIHVGHLIIASHILNETEIQKIWLIVSPQNPHKAIGSLLNEYDRLHLAKCAIDGDSRIKVLDIEFKLPKPSYTIDTLTYICDKYQKHEFFLIMGSDSYQNLPNWKNYELIIKQYKIYVYKRPLFEIKPLLGIEPIILNAPLLQISASKVRENIRQKKSVRYLVPEKVREEIEKGNYYKKILGYVT